MNISPVSNINFSGATIKNINAATHTSECDISQNVNTSISSDEIMRINKNEIVANGYSFTLKPEDVKGFYTAYCIAKQMPKGSIIDMNLYKG